jgi:hypothetical protein
MERGVKRGALVPIEQIDEVWQSAAVGARTRLLAIPDKIASRLVAARSAADVARLLRAELNEALGEIAGAV